MNRRGLRRAHRLEGAIKAFCRAAGDERAGGLDGGVLKGARLAVERGHLHLAVPAAEIAGVAHGLGELVEEAALAGVFKLSSPASDRIKIGDVAANHMRIVEEIRRRDEDGARRAMENVIRVGRARITDALGNRPAGPA